MRLVVSLTSIPCGWSPTATLARKSCALAGPAQESSRSGSQAMARRAPRAARSVGRNDFRRSMTVLSAAGAGGAPGQWLKEGELRGASGAGEGAADPAGPGGTGAGGDLAGPQDGFLGTQRDDLEDRFPVRLAGRVLLVSR